MQLLRIGEWGVRSLVRIWTIPVWRNGTGGDRYDTIHTQRYKMDG
ncbi:MAG: hypothetical protein SFY66_13325 [Oculatellaceae cyanobacterium bins.114]|nr:hypothetical protein [Oculatellaceae cyanobacterium bins.114]